MLILFGSRSTVYITNVDPISDKMSYLARMFNWNKGIANENIVNGIVSRHRILPPWWTKSPHCYPYAC